MKSQQLTLMDGDVSQRTLSSAGYYGSIIYINTKINETNKTMRIIKWESGLLNDINTFKRDDPNVQNIHYITKL